MLKCMRFDKFYKEKIEQEPGEWSLLFGNGLGVALNKVDPNTKDCFKFDHHQVVKELVLKILSLISLPEEKSKSPNFFLKI